MTGRGVMTAAMATALLLGAAVSAHAADVRTKAPAPQGAFTVRDAFAPDLNQWAPQAGRRSLQWDSRKARWGLKLDLDQPLGRSFSYSDRDVQAGAYYKITPSFRVGGSFSLGAVNDAKVTPILPDRAPKVRLETAFKF